MFDIPIEIEWPFFTVIWNNEPLIDMPKFRYSAGSCCILKEKYLSWLIENNIEYNLKYTCSMEDEEYFFILFENKDDAMLFKLTWV
jgi:hypothetical protein